MTYFVTYHEATAINISQVSSIAAVAPVVHNRAQYYNVASHTITIIKLIAI